MRISTDGGSPFSFSLPINLATAQRLEISTNKETYNLGEKAEITVKNNGNESLSFSDSLLGIRIKNLDTGQSFGLGIAAQVITQLPPGESRIFVWNQKDNEGEQAKPGNYRISLAGAITSIGDALVYANTDFNIVPSQPTPSPISTAIKTSIFQM